MARSGVKIKATVGKRNHCFLLHHRPLRACTHSGARFCSTSFFFLVSGSVGLGPICSALWCGVECKFGLTSNGFWSDVQGNSVRLPTLFDVMRNNQFDVPRFLVLCCVRIGSTSNHIWFDVVQQLPRKCRLEREEVRSTKCALTPSVKIARWPGGHLTPHVKMTLCTHLPV